MTIGQREKITYRGKPIRLNRPSFLPPHGVGYGLEGGLGIALNRTIPQGNPVVGRTILRATGTTAEETAEDVTLELRSGRRLRIRVTDIVRREELLE
ncbi:MAG: hypothetical protein AUJ08_01980 [Thaumarchaeota archaeon 13_1_40CM_3_50_5]|nr:MAG: hypothetical protein AUJ08_01980 [Thaumarchaeota archaeon 13_1_40CM_3_50_5]